MGDADARKLAEGFRLFEATDLQDLSTGEAVARIERADYDFNLSTPMTATVPDALRAQRSADIRNESRRRYGTPRAEVESLLGREWESRPEPEPIAPKPSKREADRQAPVAARVEEPPLAVDTGVHLDPSPAGAATNGVKESSAPKEAPKRPTARSPLMGKGGQEHKYLQNLIKRWSEIGRASCRERV